MFTRVAAWSFAVVLIMVPARFGAEINLSADANERTAAVWDMTAFEQMDIPRQLEDAAGYQMGAPANDSTIALDVPPLPQNPTTDEARAPKKLAALDPTEPVIATPPVTRPVTKAPSVAEAVPETPSLAEPFGLATLHVASGNVLTKWSGVEANIRADSKILARCREDVGHCPAAARDFLAIVDQGRAQTGRTRVGVINRAINLSIQPMSDLAQWGVLDRWSAPLETFTTHRGDCEDYAIAKYVALTAAGIADRDVKLVIVRNTAANEDHAIVAVRIDGTWTMLDNRWLTMIEDNKMPDVVPRFVLDRDGVRKFAPAAISDARRTAAPASF